MFSMPNPSKALVMAIASGLFLMGFIDDATAADTRFGNVLCTVASWFTGNTGKAIATVSLAAIGCWNLTGKISGRIMLMAGVGVAIIFGAAHIVDALDAGANTACNKNNL